MNSNLKTPEFLLFAQHGWSDNGNDIGHLAQALVTKKTLVFAPSLGLLNTYWRINSLIKQVEVLAQQKIAQYPGISFKIMGHSMGGLIWLEVLNRHPEWWHKIHSIVLIGSPIGGADLARIIDPLGIGIGIARDLGQNRRAIAEKIAQNIPTLCIASDLGNGSDGMITLETTKFAYSQFVCLEKIPHAHLKRYYPLVPIIQNFWSNPQINPPQSDLATKVIQYLQNIPGMTDASYHYLKRSQIAIKLPQGITIRTSKNVAGVDHVFVTKEYNTQQALFSSQEMTDNTPQQCLYAGYVGWLHASQLKKVLKQLQKDFKQKS